MTKLYIVSKEKDLTRKDKYGYSRKDIFKTKAAAMKLINNAEYTKTQHLYELTTKYLGHTTIKRVTEKKSTIK